VTTLARHADLSITDPSNYLLRATEMQVSHETIHRTLFVQFRGALRKEFTAHLRIGRADAELVGGLECSGEQDERRRRSRGPISASPSAALNIAAGSRRIPRGRARWASPS
jgi:IS30 family transposase